MIARLMKKLSRRELFRGAGAVTVGGAALAVGLKPVSKVRKADSWAGKGWSPWSPEINLPLGVPPLPVNGFVQLIEPDGTLRTIIQVRNNPAGAG